ncbi:MAG: hypothetical protein WC843_06785 [Candidatus Gracilibacteria bacterium]
MPALALRFSKTPAGLRSSPQVVSVLFPVGIGKVAFVFQYRSGLGMTYYCVVAIQLAHRHFPKILFPDSGKVPRGTFPKLPILLFLKPKFLDYRNRYWIVFRFWQWSHFSNYSRLFHVPRFPIPAPRSMRYRQHRRALPSLSHFQFSADPAVFALQLPASSSPVQTFQVLICSYFRPFLSKILEFQLLRHYGSHSVCSSPAQQLKPAIMAYPATFRSLSKLLKPLFLKAHQQRPHNGKLSEIYVLKTIFFCGFQAKTRQILFALFDFARQTAAPSDAVLYLEVFRFRPEGESACRSFLKSLLCQFGKIFLWQPLKIFQFESYRAMLSNNFIFPVIFLIIL